LFFFSSNCGVEP